jgi:hypothetical protein
MFSQRHSVQLPKSKRGENPEKILSKDILFRSNRTIQTEEQIHSHQLSVLADELKQTIKKEVTGKRSTKTILTPIKLGGSDGN